MAELVSKRYATALFELAVESNTVDTLMNDVSTVLNALESNIELFEIIKHPQVTYEEKSKLINNIFGDGIDQNLLGLFDLILKKNREAELIEILQVFLVKAKDAEGIVDAVVTTAIPLTEQQIQQIQLKLSKNMNKRIKVITNVDETLLGGMVIEADGKLFDTSIKKDLEQLKKQLLGA